MQNYWPKLSLNFLCVHATLNYYGNTSVCLFFKVTLTGNLFIQTSFWGIQQFNKIHYSFIYDSCMDIICKWGTSHICFKLEMSYKLNRFPNKSIISFTWRICRRSICFIYETCTSIFFIYETHMFIL